MPDYLSVDKMEVTNKCVVVCDLREWIGSESSAWQVLTGSQDDIGQRLASLLDEAGVQRLDDFGGVCDTFLCDGDLYKENPPPIQGSATVFSFTPKNRIAAEGQEMARVAKLAGYKFLVMTVQKGDKFGKVWVLTGLLRHRTRGALVYYDDTGSIIDELKSLPEANMIIAVHVQAPGYETEPARLADRMISQADYRHEVLA